MKVLFLDIDGVLNSQQWFAGLDLTKKVTDTQQIDPAAVELVNELLDRTGAVVVLSSSWRLLGLPHCRRVLKRRGFTGRIIDRTPIMLGWRERGEDIAAWLRGTQQPVESFVIVDDDDDMAALSHRLVQTDSVVGLTRNDMNRAVAMLGENDGRNNEAENCCTHP